jgi:iron complex transport system substrate-binding protein
MLRKLRASILALLVMAVLVAGCGGSGQETKPGNAGSKVENQSENKAPGKQTAYPLTLKDDAGRDVTIKEEPKRVISVAPSNTELIFALGKQAVLVGRSDFDDYPPEVKQIESIGGFFPPNYEKIVSLKPDLMLLVGGSDEVREKLEKEYKITTFVLQPKNFDELFADIAKLGQVLNAQAQAEKLVSDMKAAMKAVTDQTASLSVKPKVFYALPDEKELWTTGSGTFVDEVIRLAGGLNAAGSNQGWFSFSFEQLVAANPDVIVVGSEQAAAKIKGLKQLEGLKAVKESKVVVIDQNLIERPGPRLVQGLKAMAVALGTVKQ